MRTFVKILSTITILKIYFTLRNLVKLSYFLIDNFVINKLWINKLEGKHTTYIVLKKSTYPDSLKSLPKSKHN